MTSHKCKFDVEATLPICPWSSSNCHSPCDIIARGRRPAPSGVTGIETPDGYWPDLDDSRLLTPTETAALHAR